MRDGIRVVKEVEKGKIIEVDNCGKEGWKGDGEKRKWVENTEKWGRKEGEGGTISHQAIIKSSSIPPHWMGTLGLHLW